MPEYVLDDAGMATIRQMWDAGRSRQEIADAVGIPAARLFDRTAHLRGRGRLLHDGLLTLSRRQGQGGGRRPGLDHDGGNVSPEHAQHRASRVWASWSPAEREKRYQAGYLDSRDRPGTANRREGRQRWAEATEPVRGAITVPRYV
jgi:hypothetical protein